MDIYQLLKDAGVPLDSHESDLYAKVTPESQAIVKAYKAEGHSVTTFVDNIEHKLWYDIPFAYRPFWEAVERRSAKP